MTRQRRDREDWWRYLTLSRISLGTREHQKSINEEHDRPPLHPHDPVKSAGQAQGQCSEPVQSKEIHWTVKSSQSALKPAPLGSLVRSPFISGLAFTQMQFKEPLFVHTTFIKESIQPIVAVSSLPAATQQAFPPQGQWHWQNGPGQTHWNVNCGLFLLKAWQFASNMQQACTQRNKIKGEGKSEFSEKKTPFISECCIIPSWIHSHFNWNIMRN